VLFFQHLVFAFNIARRDLRGGMRARTHTLGLLIAGVLVGVAAVALVGASAQSLRDGARIGALEAVGGDLSLRLFHRGPTVKELSTISALGTTTLSAELRPMVQAGGKSLLVELKGVDRNYPLYGEILTVPQRPLSAWLENRGAVADAALLEELGLKIGDELRIGAETFQLRAKLVHEPDRVFRAFALGPRVMVSVDALPATGLAEPGAEVYFYTRVKVAPGTDPARALNLIDERFPQSGWRMVNAHAGVPGVERTLAMVHVLLLFIGLGVMLVGGAGISGAVRAHITAKMDIIAILKSIGTPPNVIALALGFEVLAGAGAGAVLGVLLGAFGPLLAASALADQLPFALTSWPSVKPMLGAGLFGLLVAVLFAWWPLMSVRCATTREVLRERFDPVPLNQGLARIGWWGALGALGIVLGLGVLVFWISPIPMLTGAFLLGGVLMAALFLALGNLFIRLAKALSGRLGAGHVLMRLALGNLHRPGAPTGAVVMALGLTLTLLVALDGIERAAARHVATTLPETAPDLVLFSIPKDRAQQLDDALSAWDGLQSKRILPFLHARVEAIRGVPVRDVKIPASLNWVVRGDRGVSFATDVPSGSVLTAGAWWGEDDRGQSLLSVDVDIAAGLGLVVGDELTLNVSGRSIIGRIANLRAVDWAQLDLDFPIVASPGALERVPHTYAASLKAKPGRAVELESLMGAAFPELARVKVVTVISALSHALGAVIAGLRVAALMTGSAALMVLAGSVLQGLRERLDEVLLFKVLGAKRSQVLVQLAAEFAVLGLAVSLVAVPLGLVVAGIVARAAGLVAWQVEIGGGLQLALLATLVTVVVGLVVTGSAYTVAPSRYLRSRGV